MTFDVRMPTHLWVEAKIQELSIKNIGVYVTHKGERQDGLVLLKLSDLSGNCKLLTQQRDIDGVLGWINVFSEEVLTEQKADEYIERSISRDPDQWVLEIENPLMENPFLS